MLTLFPPAAALAGGAVERLAASAGALASGPVPALAEIRTACREDALCAARLIIKSLGPKARLERVRHPDTDSIRRVSSMASLAGWRRLRQGGLRLDLVRFGRKAVLEIEAVIARLRQAAGEAVSAVEIDLRRNHGGNLERMLQVAALFTGGIPDAIRLSGPNRHQSLPVPARARRASFKSLTVIIGPETASSAEIFTALLRVHAGAKVVGARSYGKDYLLRSLPVSHDWRLLVPAETVSVPGTGIAGGIVPDALF